MKLTGCFVTEIKSQTSIIDQIDVFILDAEKNQDKKDNHSENEYVGPILSGGHRFDKKFICVKYPGNVINPDRAIETLGGLQSISTAVNTPNRRLELRFRPDDIYCKPTCADRHKTNGFLLRVKIKKSRIKKLEEDEAKQKKKQLTNNFMTDDNKNTENNVDKMNLSEIQNAFQCNDKDQQDQVMIKLIDQVQSCSFNILDDAGPSHENLYCENIKELEDLSLDTNDVNLSKCKKNIAPTFDRNKYEDLSEDKDYELPKLQILGRVETEFKFTNLCDFQYLPITQSKEDPKKLECIYDKIYPSNMPHYSWLKNDVPYFLPPAAFSRMDTVQQYIPKTEVNSSPEKTRKRRAGFLNFVDFSTAEVPSKPPAGIETAMKVKFIQNIHFEQIRQIFEERPIWSKNAIMYKTKFSSQQLKILLPAVSYYFVNGPWKILWVKLGYDPRKDISARIYQILDYRVRAMHGLTSTVKCKRNYSEYTLPYKSTPVSKQKTIVQNTTPSQEQNSKKEQDLHENVYIYREGTIPPSRQMFYQYCDVLVDEIQEMLAKLPDPLPGTKCDEKRGWLPSGFDVQCREIINKQVRIVLRKQMNIPDDHPTSLPRKRKYKMKLKRNKFKTKKRKKQNNSVSSEEENEKYDQFESTIIESNTITKNE
ncbi:general transcription factor 3C polypeptide 5 isoform X2 [Apis laboriosa]|uniref:general transcription factor 3C polypeptide 5 isoform X2 n=1 Tax=Apis laboriosa TaxID=183418 RepID=UPI001CC65A6C|nr:general transcription factor 3C polypeptide 5 isoform X2 [Apis laboriosa]